MRLYQEHDSSWPSRVGRMDQHPIAVVVKAGRIISAYLYEDQDEYGLVGEPIDEWHSGELWGLPA